MNDSGFKLFSIHPLNVLCKDRRLLRSTVNIEHMRTLLSWGSLQTPHIFLSITTTLEFLQKSIF